MSQASQHHRVILWLCFLQAKKRWWWSESMKLRWLWLAPVLCRPPRPQSFLSVAVDITSCIWFELWMFNEPHWVGWYIKKSGIWTDSPGFIWCLCVLIESYWWLCDGHGRFINGYDLWPPTMTQDLDPCQAPKKWHPSQEPRGGRNYLWHQPGPSDPSGHATPSTTGP